MFFMYFDSVNGGFDCSGKCSLALHWREDGASRVSVTP